MCCEYFCVCDRASRGQHELIASLQYLKAVLIARKEWELANQVIWSLESVTYRIREAGYAGIKF